MAHRNRSRVAIALATMLLAGCGSGDGAAATSTSTASLSAASSSGSVAADGNPDGPIDIGGGREIYLHCTGRGSPTVILESGYHDASSLWSIDEPTPPAVGPSVQERLSAHVQVCSYDRPGTITQGAAPALTDRSTPVPNPRPPSAAVADLHTLIGAAGLPTPVVIVAHSMGGLLARLYAQTFPDEVSGLVFVDSFPVELKDGMGVAWPAYQELLAAPGTTFDGDPAFEVFDVDAGIAEIAAAAPLPVIPMLVLSKTEPFPIPDSAADIGSILERAWPVAQEDLVALGTDTPHVIATGSTHYIQVEQPDLVADSALVVIGRASGS